MPNVLCTSKHRETAGEEHQLVWRTTPIQQCTVTFDCLFGLLCKCAQTGTRHVHEAGELNLVQPVEKHNREFVSSGTVNCAMQRRPGQQAAYLGCHCLVALFLARFLAAAFLL